MLQTEDEGQGNLAIFSFLNSKKLIPRFMGYHKIRKQIEENLMLTKREQDIREQIQIATMDALVPKDHILRLVDEAIDFDFIYDLVEDKYCSNNGRPSLDPVVLIKLPVIYYLCGIRSM